MTWHGQINRTIWEIETRLRKKPNDLKLRRELVRTHFLQRYEYDRGLHTPRDDRSFLFLQNNETSALLLIHGAHGTPAEMRELGNYLYARGFTVYCPRLSRYDLRNRLVSWESWVTMAENALATMLRYSSRTAVIGLSLGGTIALVLERLQKVKGMVLLAPAVHAKLGLRRPVYAVTRRVAPALYQRFAGWNAEVAKAMEYVRRTEQEIKSPTLVLQARDDHVISTKGLKLLRRWATADSSEVVLLPFGSHALTRGKAKEEIFERIYKFAQKIRLVHSPR